MKKIILIITLIILSATLAFADTVTINHFAIKENPFAQSEIAISAVDTAHNVLENVNGVFSFTVNGFAEDLKFDKGTAFYHHKLDKSSFLYVKHVNENGTHAILYYVYKGDHTLTPIHISWIVLLAIPIILIVLGYMFKKFIIIAAVIFVIFIFFNYHNGLGAGTFFESIVDGLKSIFNKV
jgi:hypothetical protein